MRLTVFLAGMMVAAGSTAAVALMAGLSAWAAFGLALGTMLIAQLLYLGLVLVMARDKAGKHPLREADTKPAAADKTKSALQTERPS